MKWKFFAMVLGLMLWGSANAAETDWGTDLNAALKTASVKNLPVLLQFNAPWCPYCKKMAATVFPSTGEQLGQFVRVVLDIDKNAEVAKRHNVRGIPAFVVLSPDGDEMAATSGFMEAEPFGKWLGDSRTALATSMADKADFNNKKKELESTLSSQDITVRQKGVLAALALCDRKEKVYQNLGLEKLKALAHGEPVLLLDALNDPQLGTRIRIANLLKAELGDEFKVDPWEKSEVREKEIKEWKTRLTVKAGK